MRPMPLRQNAALSRFELDVEGGIAFANYRIRDGVMSITHTEVPQALRERGVGARLVRATLEAARAQGFKVRPLCSFARAYVDRHPEFADLTA